MIAVEVYQAKDGWRWRLTAANGKVVADSGEAYDTEFNAQRAARRTKELFADGGD